MSSETYIVPQTAIYLGKDELFKNLERSHRPLGTRQIDLDEVLKGTAIEIVLADPGYGKSRLLLELAKRCLKNKKPVYFRSLKNVNGTTSIESPFQDREKYPSLEKEPEIGTPIFSNLHEEENSKKLAIAFFDGLDEVRESEYVEVVRNLVKFARNFPKTKILISGRSHIFFRHQTTPLLSMPELRFHHIGPLDTNEVIQFLDLSESEAKDYRTRVAHLITFRIPRYLTFVKDLAKKYEIRKIFLWTRAKLFEQILELRLKSQEKKRGKGSHRFYFLIALRHLAFFMELRQTNTLDGESFAEFEMECLNGVFLNQNLLSDFLENTIVRRTDDHIEFDNTELQEYLAAKHLLRLGPGIDILNQVAIDISSNRVHHSWLESVGFQLEENPEIFVDLIVFLCQSDFLQDRMVFSKLAQYANFDFFSSNDKLRIAEAIFEHISDHNVWIQADAAGIISQCFSDKTNNYLLNQFDVSKNDDYNQFIRNGNLAILIDALSKRKHFVRRYWTKWRNRMEKIALLENGYDTEVPQRRAISALERIGTKNSLNKVKVLYARNNNLKESIRWLSRRFDPNSIETIDRFCDSIHEHRMSSGIFIDAITSHEGHLYLLRKLKEDKKSPFLWQKLEVSIEYANNLEKIWSATIETEVFRVVEHILRTDHRGFNQELPQVILIAWQRKMPNLISHLVQTLSDKAALWLLSKPILKSLIREEDMELLKNNWQTRFGKHTDLRACLDSIFEGKEREKLLSVFPEITSDLAKKSLDVRSWEGREYRQSLTLYEAFKDSLNKGNFKALFLHFEHRDRIQKHLSPADKKKLIALSSKLVQQYSLENLQTAIRSISDSQAEYQLSRKLDPLIIAIEILVSVPSPQIHHQEIAICILPLITEPNAFKSIAAQIAFPSPQLIARFCKFWHPDSGDGRLTYGFSKFMEMLWKFRITAFIPYVKEMALHPGFQNHFEQGTIAETLKDFRVEEAFFQERFESSNLFKVKIVWAKILFKEFGNIAATKWIFAEAISFLKPRPKIPFPRSSTLSARSKIDELDLDKLDSISFPQLRSDVIQLLSETFRLLLVDREYYHEIEREIWPGINGYLSNLIRAGHLGIIDDVARIFKPYKSNYPVSFYSHRLADYKNLENHIQFQKQPIYSAIRKFQLLKEKQTNPFDSEQGFFRFVKDCITEDLEKWLQASNKSHALRTVETNEILFQELIQSKLKEFMIERGLMGTAVIREAQTLTGNRIDFWVSYGMFGRVLIELKLKDNPDISPNNLPAYSKNKLDKYRFGLNVRCLILLVLKVDDKPSLRGYKNRLEAAQNEFKGNEWVDVIGINCFPEIETE